MKLNETQLRKIIKEGVQNVLNEMSPEFYDSMFRHSDYQEICEILSEYADRNRTTTIYGFFAMAVHAMEYKARMTKDKDLYEQLQWICDFLINERGLTEEDINKAIDDMKYSFRVSRDTIQNTLNLANKQLQNLSNQSQPMQQNNTN
jgi:polyhydroxyalkanoate synthesis regulator phasin